MLPEIDETHPRIVALREGLALKIPVPAHQGVARAELLQLDLSGVLWAWINWAYRSVPARKRTIIVANGFDISSATPTERDALADIRNRIEAGDELRPYLSRKNATHGYSGSSAIGKNKPKWIDADGDKDLALNAYQIHHLHVGKIKFGSEYCTGTRKLVYIHFTRNTAILVHFGDHNSFNDGSLAQAAAHWHAQRGFHLQGVVGLSVEYDESELKSLERAGVSSARRTDFGFVPSAVMSQGHSLVASMHADDCWHAINQIEHRLKTNSGQRDLFMELGIVAPINESNIIWGMSHCDLTIGNGETNQGVVILPGPH